MSQGHKGKGPHSCRSKFTLWDVCLASVCLVVSSAGSEFCVSYNISLNSTDEGSDGGQTVARQKQKHLTVGDEIIMIKKKKKKKMQSWIIIVGCWNAFFYSMPVSVRPWCVDDWRKKKRKKLAVSSKLLLECWIEDLDWIENRAKWHILAWFCVSVSEVQMFPPLMGSRRWQTVKMKRRGSTDWRDVLEKSQSLSFLHSLWKVSSD